MGTMVSTYANVGEYDGYILELLPPYQLPASAALTLSESFEEMAKGVGGDKVYVRNFDEEEQIKLMKNFGLTTGKPAILILESHPEVALKEEEEIKAIAFVFERIDRPTDVSEVLNLVINCMNEEDFMRRLTWEKRKRALRELLSTVSTSADIGMSIVSTF